MKKFFVCMSVIAVFALIVAAVPQATSAHEVYVLTPDEIAHSISNPSPNPFTAIPGQEKLFLIWGTIVAISFLLVLTASVTPTFENVFDPILMRLKKYAPLAGRLTFGVALIYSGHFGDFFGPELPATASFPPGVAHVLGTILIIMGVMVCLGFMTRIISAIMLCLFVFTIFQYGIYMLTYVNYLGEIILFLILGGGMWSLDTCAPGLKKLERRFKQVGDKIEKYSFFILRILFGTAIFFASFYAKFFNSNLALKTVTDYHLTNYFHFTPLFLVLGAFIIEALIGLCFAAGFEIRFAALVFTFFITLSITFFGEAVWPHIILFGVNIVLFFHGYDKYTLEMAVIQRQRKGEPVL